MRHERLEITVRERGDRAGHEKQTREVKPSHYTFHRAREK